jgi:O-antigen ligase
MKKGPWRGAVVVPVSILTLQFLLVPFLGDMDRAGKLFLFVFPVLFMAIQFLAKDKEVKFSSAYVVFILLWVIFVISAGQAYCSYWAFIQSCIFASFVIYLGLLTDFSVKNPLLGEYLNTSLLFFGLLAAILGLYEYFHFVLIGPSRATLIPYLLPPDGSIRVAGVFGQPNLFALFLSVVLLAYCYFFVHSAFNTASRAFFHLRFLPFFVIALVFFLTGSRAGFLSLTLVWGFLLWLVASRRYLSDNVNGRKEIYHLSFCLVCALVVSQGFNGFGDSRTAIGTLSTVGMGTDARFVFWMEAFLVFLKNPWLGVGLDNYGFLQDAYGPSAHKLLGFVPYEAMLNTDWAHNELLQILCEGGLFAFCLVLFLLFVLLWKIKSNFINRNTQFSPIFLYSHLFLLPFIVQSMFSWPFRSPPLLVLFFSFLGVLLSQYPLRTIRIPAVLRRILMVFIFLGVCATLTLFYQEIRIGAFKRSLVGAEQPEATLGDFDALVSHPYSTYRVLNNALPLYSMDALRRNDVSLGEKIIPYFEQLTSLEGARWQWYNLARIYFLVGREEEARAAIKQTIDLMPSDDIVWAFDHYLDMLKASRETGRPLESFLPHGEKFDLNALELMK